MGIVAATPPTRHTRSVNAHDAPSSLSAHFAAVSVLLLPFFFDTLAFVCYLFSRSRPLYTSILLSFEVVTAVGALVYALPAWRTLVLAYGLKFLWPAIFYSIALSFVLLGGSGNQEFVLAAMRYLPWMMFATGMIVQLKLDLFGAQHLKILRPIASLLALFALAQWMASPLLAEDLAILQRGLMPPEKTNAVLTSIELGKSFASLSLRNPIELGYVGLLLLCIGCACARQGLLILCGLILVAAGRSNTTLIAAILILTVHALRTQRYSKFQRFALSAIGGIILILILFTLPNIYLGTGSNWNDLIETLGMQRLGLVLAIPGLIADAGWSLLIRGLPIALEPLVEDLFQAGLLPSLFADGGAIAVFDIMWFGMLLVGGLPFAFGGLALLLLARSKICGRQYRAVRLYALGALIISFSSQVLLSRYGLYFLCMLLAANAASMIKNSQSMNK